MLATGSADASLIIWRIQLDHQDEPWQLLTRLQVPSMPLQTSILVVTEYLRRCNHVQPCALEKRLDSMYRSTAARSPVWRRSS